MFVSIRSLLSQDGSSVDQFPLSKHVRSLSPTITKPSSQVWVATEPKVVKGAVVSPLSGVPGSPQSMTK